MTRFLGLAAASAAIALGSMAFAASAFADDVGVRAGMLTCSVDGGWGYVFGSSRGMKCVYSGPSDTQHYVGTIAKYGLDVGYTEGGTLVWAVLAPTKDLAKGSLQGDYAGGTGGISIGIGASANALFGGSSDQVALQPVSLEGNTGFNISGGVATLKLTYQP